MSGESQDLHFRDQCLDDALNITVLETVLLSSQPYFHVGTAVNTARATQPPVAMSATASADSPQFYYIFLALPMLNARCSSSLWSLVFFFKRKCYLC